MSADSHGWWVCSTLCVGISQNLVGRKKTAANGLLYLKPGYRLRQVCWRFGGCRDAACYENLFTSRGTEKLDGDGVRLGYKQRTSELVDLMVPWTAIGRAFHFERS